MACSPRHIWMNGSLAWLSVKGGAVWLPRVPAVTPRHTEGGWLGPLHLCGRALISRGRGKKETGVIHKRQYFIVKFIFELSLVSEFKISAKS